jgi:Polysaccharide pyruvyl transferase
VKVLVAGWFSFEQMGATAGDLLARDLARDWLVAAGHEVDLAHAAPFGGGVDWRELDPRDYSCVVFVCGPFGNGPPLVDFLERFAGTPLVGLDLTMLEPLDVWNPFDLLLERDSSRTARPDISFLSEVPPVPVVGLVLIPSQPEYGGAGRHASANAKLEQLAAETECARVHIDTRLDTNLTGHRTPAEVAAAIARMDVVLTTRLHGMALALASGVPAVVVDPVAGGAKITRQAATLGWSRCFPAEVGLPELRAAFRDCLTQESRQEARNVAGRARRSLGEVREAFAAHLQTVG